MPLEMSVRLRVWLTESLMILRQRLLAALLQVLAHAVEDDDGVVHAVADQGQEGGDDVERDLVLEEGEEAERDEHVVEDGDGGRRPPHRAPEAEGDVDELEEEAEDRELDGLAPQLRAHHRPHDLGARTRRRSSPA